MGGTKKFAVVGATGRVGRHVVELLRAEGHRVVSVSRSTGVDVVTGEGLAEALRGVDVIIDVASTPSPDQDEATKFFTSAARNLHEAGQAAGVRWMLVVSIIGIDGAKAGYNAAKLAHERAALAGPLPVRILRAAQFDEFVEPYLRWGTQGEVAYLPRMRTQLVAARAVAAELAAMATGPAPTAPATAPFPEVAGPREETMAGAARLVAARRGLQVEIREVVDPDDPDAGMYADGALLPGAHATLAGPTFEEWLTESH
ncbi:NAD(P)H-binding protein [Actinomadura kijaniata]|uniref:Uncharacterized protein YbjT (DUF2867 family) n=1 Tax=Actinomadura namibiensis TaxID=182080 RepID=A0A7W3LNL6_ACTNM|nr:NAD(P)H-binding protein [Actinomadura namibiensis]MBA8951409.1 uncharacterized protein YbjT (DUF2867 family) [Actinomadura namibiensis]